jgi:hypothetical protein
MAELMQGLVIGRQCVMRAQGQAACLRNPSGCSSEGTRSEATEDSAPSFQLRSWMPPNLFLGENRRLPLGLTPDTITELVLSVLLLRAEDAQVGLR